MGCDRLILLCVVLGIATRGYSHRHHSYQADNKENDYVDHSGELTREDEKIREVIVPEESQIHRRSFNMDESKRIEVPFSARRLEKMLEKAILKIITGDLSTADKLLLKSLNYSLEEVEAIRERELAKKRSEELRKENRLKYEKRKFYNENNSKKRDKHWSQNTMEFDYSSRSDFDGKYSKEDWKKDRYNQKSNYDNDFDFEAYNRQAVVDYENLAAKLDLQQSKAESALLDYEENVDDSKEKDSVENFHRSFDRAMEPHVVFKIRYDDSEFDSSSDEKFKSTTKSHATSKISKHHGPSTLRHAFTTSSNSGNSFHASQSSPSSALRHTPLPVVYRMNNFNAVKSDYSGKHFHATTTESTEPIDTTTQPQVYTKSETDNEKIKYDRLNDTESTTKKEDPDAENSSGNVVDKSEISVEKIENVKPERKISEYEGLEWVEDDVYRVIPALVDNLGYDNDDNETSDYTDNSYYMNDTLEYQNDQDPVKLFMANNFSMENVSMGNLSSYQQLAIAHRRDQGQKAIEDIKSRVLALTGRFNLSVNTNQVQRERLTMFPPSCQVPRNTDPEAWADPFSMNMHFQLNLTSGDHVVAAKLRIYKLPQQNLTSSSGSTFEDEDEDENKIRISIYYYTKSLKKHRSKKRLMDSVVTPLSYEGTHLALDVRQGLRFWRLNPRNQHGNGSNHGLVIQVEDQDGRPLKPALYIQQLSCLDHDSDQKAYHRQPALFVRACTRYVRIVNGETVTYVNCRH